MTPSPEDGLCGAQHPERAEVVCDRRGVCPEELAHLSRAHRVVWGGREPVEPARELVGRDALAGIVSRSSSGVRAGSAADALRSWSRSHGE